MGPDEEALRADLNSCGHRVGERRGKWQFVKLEFPVLYLRVRASTRAAGPPWFLLRIDCQGYPGAAPTAQLWDGQRGCAVPLEQRPHGRNGVLIAFSQWQACLYHPIDRMARMHWPNQYPELAWSAGKDITFFLETVHGLLNDPQYLTAKAGAAAAYLLGEPVAADPV